MKINNTKQLIDYLLNLAGSLVDKSNMILTKNIIPFDKDKSKLEFESHIDIIIKIINKRLKPFNNKDFLNEHQILINNYQNSKKSIQDGFDLYYELIDLIEKHINKADIIEFNNQTKNKV